MIDFYKGEWNVTFWMSILGLIENPALMASLSATVVAQVVKVPIAYIATRKWDFSQMTSTGGMPSSHSAAVSSLATVIGFHDGTRSSLFAACVVFAIIVMYDAAGIRRHAGEQAIALNKLKADIGELIDRRFADRRAELYQQRLKEMLGHQPIEVLMGCILGILLGSIVSAISYA